MTVQCANCGRFVSRDTAIEYVEYGDYGTVHSVEWVCSRCEDGNSESERTETRP